MKNHHYSSDARTDASAVKVATYLHTDHLGTPKFGTNSSGTSVWTWVNDAFGTSTPTGTATVNLRMAGQYYDSESGLFYNINRSYNPAIGRYMSSDRIGLPGGLNTFLYAMANPVNLLDLYGFWPSKWPVTGPGEDVPDTTFLGKVIIPGYHIPSQEEAIKSLTGDLVKYEKIAPDVAQRLAKDITDTFCDSDKVIALEVGSQFRNTTPEDFMKLNLGKVLTTLDKTFIQSFIQRLPAQDQQPIVDMLSKQGLSVTIPSK